MEVFAVVALAIAGGSVSFLVVLTFRRVLLAAGERRRVELERRLRPIALALVDRGTLPPTLSTSDAAAFAVLVGRYAHRVRGEARETIARYFEQSGTVDATTARLHDRRTWRRAEAAYALGEMGSRRAARPLIDALADSERDVRSAAARSLGRLEEVRAVEPLLARLVDERVPRAVVGAALLAIGRDAVPELLELANAPQPRERAVAVQLIGLLGDAGHAAALMPRVLDTAAEVRAEAAVGLGRLGAAEAAEAVRELLQDRIPFVRTAAAVAAGLLNDAEAVEALLAQARHDLFDPARAAAQALRRIAPARLREASRDRLPTDQHLLEAAGLASL